MELTDSRRLTGFNLLGPKAGAVSEVRFEESDSPEALIEAWKTAVGTITKALGWRGCTPSARRSQHGASLYFPAKLDVLYAATEANEWAVAAARGEAAPLEEALEAIRSSMADEANPSLMALQAEANKRGAPFVWDDDWVSLGMGRHSQTWPWKNLPAPDEIDWEVYRRIPSAYVTGTNGKTTTTRMAARILQVAGMTTGTTSSDGVSVNEALVEEGDWTGTGAARRVLRHTDVEVAVLETARGGMLRRGLVLEECDAALVTNVSSDHLGEYGIDTVEDMARVKGLVFEAVRPDGTQVINAEDPLLRGLELAPASRCWFSTRGRTDFVQGELIKGARAWVLENNWLCFCVGDQIERVLSVEELHSAHGGAAFHNIANALGAAGLAQSLGADLNAIREALRDFGKRAEDNPGRCTIRSVNGVRLLLDFGHNPKGVEAILQTGRLLIQENPGARLWVSIGQAGDRSDADLLELAEAVGGAKPDRVSLREVPGYERGRGYREVAGILKDRLITAGQNASAIDFHEGEIDSMRAALDWARPGDLVVHLVHLKREAINALLAEAEQV